MRIEALMALEHFLHIFKALFPQEDIKFLRQGDHFVFDNGYFRYQEPKYFLARLRSGSCLEIRQTLNLELEFQIDFDKRVFREGLLDQVQSDIIQIKTLIEQVKTFSQEFKTKMDLGKL